MSDNKSDLEEWSTPKLTGAGDGFKTFVSSRKKAAIPSSRKFNARVPQDKNLKLKLEHALRETEGKECKKFPKLKKATSIAEITPTRNKLTSKSKLIPSSSSNDCTTLHATPRPMDKTPSPRRCLREKATCTVYQRLLLCVWRRSRARLASLTESSRRQVAQITQLEMQIDVLRQLRQSECDKRDDALNECRQLQKDYELLKSENSQLLKLETELANSENHLKNAENELKSYEEKVASTQEILRKKQFESIVLEDKISKQDKKMLSLKSTIKQLKENLKNTENKLNVTDSSYQVKKQEYDDLLDQLQSEIDTNNSLDEKLKIMGENQKELSAKLTSLQNLYVISEKNVNYLTEENNKLKLELKRAQFELLDRKTMVWWKNTEEYIVLALGSLHNVALLLLPAYRQVDLLRR